jgi:hypothetical protein
VLGHGNFIFAVLLADTYHHIYLFIYLSSTSGMGGGAWTGLIWLRIGTDGGLFGVRWWTFGFHKMRENSWLAENRLVSQEGLCSIKYLFIYGWKMWGLNPDRIKKFIFPNRPDRLCDSLTSLYSGNQGSFPRVELSRNDFDHSPQLIRRLRMSGAVLLLHLYIYMICAGRSLAFTS